MNVTTQKNLQDNEAQIVRRAIRGDAEAFAQLYDAYAVRIYRFIHFRVSNVQLAEDLAADTFLKAWDHLQDYEERGVPFGAWLFRIARNTVIDHYRTDKETASLEAATTEASGLNINERVARRLAADEIVEAMEALTTAQREVIILKFFTGLKTKTVAQILDKRQGAIRALQMRGLQALNNALVNDDD